MELYFATDHPLRFTIRADGLRRDGTRVRRRDELGDRRDRGRAAAAGDRARHDRAPRGDGAPAAPVAPAGGGRGAGRAGAGRRGRRPTSPPRRSSGCARRCRSARRGPRATARRSPRGAPAADDACALRDRIGDEVFGDDLPVEGELGEDEENFLRGIANVLATAMGRLRGEERMRHEALHDPLTGLANRALCRERLIHALARTGRDDGRRPACCSSTSTTSRRQRPLRPRGGRRAADRARPPAGGDGAPGGHRRAAGRRRVRGRLRGHRRAHRDRARPSPDRGDPRAAGRRRDRAPAVGASIGIALGAAGRRDPDALLADADAAAYRAKAEGRGRVEVFDTRLRRARARAAADGGGAGAGAVARAAAARLPADRRRSDDGAVVGHEALLRWDSPGGVMHAPGGLHPGRGGVGADRRDRRLDADAGVPRERGGFGVARTGRRSGSTSPRRQLAQPDLPGAGRRRACARAGCPPRRLRLELKETVLLQARPRPRGATSRSCARIGRRPRAGRLRHRLLLAARPAGAAAVKIDRSFVGGLGRTRGDTAIVAAIVSLAARAGHRRDRRGRRARGAGGTAARARLPARAGLSVRRARCANRHRKGTLRDRHVRRGVAGSGGACTKRDPW